MNINQAIKKMEKGYKVKIATWVGSGHWQIIADRISCVNMNCSTNNPYNAVLLKSKDWIVIEELSQITGKVQK